MAETLLPLDVQVQRWSAETLAEYVRASGFASYTGTSANSIFRIRRNLQSQAGYALNFPLRGRLTGSGVTGAQVLEGNEEDLSIFNDRITVDWRRHAVVLPKSTTFRTEIDMMNEAREGLVDWFAEKTRDQIADQLGGIVVRGAPDAQGLPGTDTVLTYGAASAAQRNAFLTLNRDRILFGSARGNSSSNVWATSLGNVDNTADRLTANVIMLAKRMARTPGSTQRKITPYRTEGGREYFVMFVGSLPFRDLKNDPLIREANVSARPREVASNPLFQDGDLLYDGVIIREIPELPIIAGGGASGIDVQQGFLCGQHTLGIAYGQMPTPQLDRTRDYNFRPGVGMEELVGYKKTSFDGVQYGAVTVITAAVGDA